MMERNVDLPSLAGQDIDPETFQRVWGRVNAGQAAPRSDSVPDTAVPAQPTEEQPPAEEPPAEETPELSPVPDCPAEPVCPECPECPSCPECPGTSGTAPTPEAPVFCLGEASQGDSARLEELMTLALTGAAAVRAMTRRAGGTCARTLAALGGDHRSAFKRLSAAYFLITGTRYTPKCSVPSLPASLPLALRRQFVWEQQWEQKNKEAAQAAADPCLKELYLELAQEGAFHAGCIRSILEQMA